jgi:hypothetical protein
LPLATAAVTVKAQPVTHVAWDRSRGSAATA